MLVAILITSLVIEFLIILIPKAWKYRGYLVAAPLIGSCFGLASLIALHPSWWLVFALLVLVFRVINYLRMAKGRIHQKHLRRASLRTSTSLAVLQLISIIPIWVNMPNADQFVIGLIVSQLVFALSAFILTMRSIQKTTHESKLKNYSDKELPTVTVAIPARNETKDLEECLRSVLANPYPKLEILVLDDCSQDKTAEVIKSFAHQGVRFIKGAEPSDRWLAKNLAYDRLADEANGELILFCGVDVRFGPDAIRALVTTMLERNKKMISVLPRRLTSRITDVFVQPLRYWWELTPPRRYFNRPPVLSTCWLIDRKTLLGLGGFDAVSRSVLPEGYFAREIIKSDGYTFIRADDILDVQTRKSLGAQRDTAIRMRYPQIKKRLELALLITAGEILLMLLPFAVAISGLLVGFGAVQIAALISCILLSLTHVMIVQISNPANVLAAGFSFPFAVIIELILSYTSLFRYEFSTVEWRGRNICIPVMRVISAKEMTLAEKAN